MAGDKTNPSLVGGTNEYYGLAVEGSLSPAIGVPLEQGGNTVDRARINKTMGASGSESQAKPLGQPVPRPGY